jgi:phosphate transport system substrate-binding protein
MQVVFGYIFKVKGAFAAIATGRVFLITACGLICLLTACSGKAKVNVETPISGTIHISVDESFQPIIDSEIKVFESSYPDAHIIPHYRAEAACFRDLAADSARMIIVTRGLSAEEEKFYEESPDHYKPTWDILAYDAIAVIVNPKSKDSLFDMEGIRSMLNGGDVQHLPVMDGLSATSTVRYAIDSILQGKPLSRNVTAARSSPKVIDYVADNPRAVGFIGVSWIGDPDDPKQESFLKKVSIAAIGCVSCRGETHVKPYQANIALKRYPMVRGLYYILKENFSGVGNNFVNFMNFERGQLIFRRAYLFPAQMSFEVRDMQISN